MSVSAEDYTTAEFGSGTGTTPSTLRRNLTASWVIGVVIFTLARFFVARETLIDYDINIWLFGFVDLVTAVPYALGVAKIVAALVDRDGTSATWWAVVATGSFLAPYAYIAVAGHGAAMPGAVYVALAVLIAVFGTNALWSIRRRVRTGRDLV